MLLAGEQGPSTRQVGASQRPLCEESSRLISGKPSALACSCASCWLTVLHQVCLHAAGPIQKVCSTRQTAGTHATPAPGCCCLLQSWCTPAGLAVELSDRPLLCVAAHWEAAEVVLGGSDHALYVIDVRSARKKRTLYTKTCGHTE